MDPKNSKPERKPHEGIAGRFGDAFAKDNYIPLPKTLYPILKEVFGIKQRHVASVFVALCEWCDIEKTGFCHPSYQQIIEVDPWLTDKTISSAIKVLQQKLGLVVVPGNMRLASVYNLTEPLRLINDARRAWEKDPKIIETVRKFCKGNYTDAYIFQVAKVISIKPVPEENKSLDLPGRVSLYFMSVENGHGTPLSKEEFANV